LTNQEIVQRLQLGGRRADPMGKRRALDLDALARQDLSLPNHYVGIDVSLEASSVYVVDGNGKIVREGKIVSEPDALIAWLGGLKLELTRIGLEAGPLSQMALCGDAPRRTCGRAVGDTARAQRTQDNAGEDRPQRRGGIAQLMRLGWFRPVHCKSIPAQETRALLTARKLVHRFLDTDPILAMREDSVFRHGM
jgi:transposase